MFGKKIIIYITKTKIWALQEDNFSNELVIEWNSETLVRVFNDIKKKLNAKSFKIILGSSISYAFTLLEKENELSREEILNEIKKIIPKETDNESFDWQVVGRYEGVNDRLVQVCGLSKDNLNLFSLASDKNKIDVEFMLPVSVLLAWEARKVERPHLILWSGQENIGIIAQSGIVYYAKSLGEDVQIKAEELVRIAKEKFGFEIKDLVLNVNKWQGVSQIFPGWQENHYELNPFEEMANHNSEESMEDEDVLEIKAKENVENEGDSNKEELKINTYDQQEVIDEIKDENKESEEANMGINDISNQEEENINREPEKKSKYVFVILGAFIFLAIGVASYFVFGNRNQQEKTEQPSIVSTPLPSPTPINLSPYKIQVLNGSGIEGHAGLGQERLEEAGFSGIETDNATEFDYEETEIIYKKEIPSEVVEKIREALSDHESTSSAELDDEEEIDVRVILGSLREKIEDEEAQSEE